MFDFDESTVTPEEIDQCMELIFENLLAYLDEILHDRDRDSLHAASKSNHQGAKRRMWVTEL